MKKSQLYYGIGYTIFGLVCLGIALATEWAREGMLWGLAGAGIGPGLGMIWKYVHWTRPGNRQEYDEKLKQERIELRDERKVMLRDKSGCITYRIMIGVYCVLLLVFSILSVLGYWNPMARYMVILVSLLLLFQFICGIIVFNHLNKTL